MNYTWNTLPIGKYVELFEATKGITDEDELVMRSAAVLNDVTYDEIMNMPLEKAVGMIQSVGFLYTKPEDRKPQKKYDLGGRVYVPTLKVEKMTTAQYIDFQAISAHSNEMLAEMLAIFIIPEGHIYNDGYDNDEVVDDIRKYLSAEEGFALANFFVRKCIRSMRLTLLYYQSMMTVLNMKEQNKEVKEMIRQLQAKMEELDSLLG